jgi:hypothetical protein
MKKPLLSFLLLLPLAFAPQEPQPREAGSEQPRATVGQPAPGFRLNDEAGAMTEFGGPSKTWTALAFYPKAMTGG